jgi:two-component sensor histidine kinase
MARSRWGSSGRKEGVAAAHAAAVDGETSVLPSLQRLIETDFMPHGYCYLWFPEILWLHVFSDGLIALAYFLIPASLFTFVLRRREIPFPWMFLMFAAFITACGLTHVMGIWTIWRPDYGVEGLVKLGTGLVSITTALTLIPLIPRALALRSPSELAALNRALEAEAAEHRDTAAALNRARAELENEVAQRTAELSQSNAHLQAEIERRRQAQEQQQFLMRELNHRVKNILATVQSLVTQTRIGCPSPEAFAEALDGRLSAFAKVHNLLTESRWQGATLADLVAAETAPYRSQEAGNVMMRGEPVLLRPQAALALSLALHELATNAAKYGALSVPGGRIDVSWWRENAMLIIEWAESGGPAVQPPSHRGFGSKLIERSVAHELEGVSGMDFRPAGLRCELKIPLAGITALPNVPAASYEDTSRRPAEADSKSCSGTFPQPFPRPL